MVEKGIIVGEFCTVLNEQQGRGVMVHKNAEISYLFFVSPPLKLTYFYK